MEKKRLEQLRESWIKNVVRIYDLSRQDAEDLYERLAPWDKNEYPKEDSRTDRAGEN